jgi:hypothetical protein
MPRKPRIEIGGGLYHVITRSSNRHAARDSNALQMELRDHFGVALIFSLRHFAPLHLCVKMHFRERLAHARTLSRKEKPQSKTPSSLHNLEIHPLCCSAMFFVGQQVIHRYLQQVFAGS